ncbi:hypothetical protein [Xanthovirga aplysinae]|uniref:hypothetical protein n=1 Tax=Xanthovirga aplysinae TaxID=2529853 RepID=UPI0012BBE65B|nr:hypothetical protein [Xanthovirga aplysinae]MTI31844.1 hypothetical protein [Xanthovirga aplysinae]
MVEKLKYLPVNWIDGMKINEGHFNDLQNHITEGLKDVTGIGLNHLNFGLLPPQSSKEMLNISMAIDNHKLLRIKINQCKGVTVNGARIEITEDTAKELDCTYEIVEGQETILFIVLSIYPFDRTAIGTPFPEETPPRHPFTSPKYRVTVIDKNTFLGSSISPYLLPIGQIKILGKEATLVDEYIPPCNMTRCHSKLIETYSLLDKFLGELELLCVQIAQKINQKKQISQLTELILLLTQNIVTFLGDKITSFRWLAQDSPPAFMFEIITRLARQIKNTIDLRSGTGKEELLNFLSEWCGLSQGQFETLFTDLSNNQYEHNDIAKTQKLVVAFAETIKGLFSTLNRLDYIGKRKESSIFVGERKLLNDEPKNKLKPKRSIFLVE